MIGMTMRFIGRLWGGTFLRFVILSYTYYRVSLFDIRTDGVDHLLGLRGQPYILVANHIHPLDTLLKMFKLRPLKRFNHAIDSFVLQRVAYQEARHNVRVVAKFGRDTWNPKPILRFLQRHVRQPLTQGQLEGAGYIPIDLKPGVGQRDFMRAVEQVVRKREALLVFPEGDAYDDFQPDREMHGGAAHLARKYNLPILPVFLTGCHTWRPGQGVTVRFGSPIHPEGLTKQRITGEIRRGIVSLRDPADAKEAVYSTMAGKK